MTSTRSSVINSSTISLRPFLRDLSYLPRNRIFEHFHIRSLSYRGTTIVFLPFACGSVFICTILLINQYNSFMGRSSVYLFSCKLFFLLDLPSQLPSHMSMWTFAGFCMVFSVIVKCLSFVSMNICPGSISCLNVFKATIDWNWKSPPDLNSSQRDKPVLSCLLTLTLIDVFHRYSIS